MAYTNTNTNMTTSSGLSVGMQTYYNRTLLKTFEPNLVHLQFGENYPLPANSGKVMQMRKLIPIEGKTTPLEEGNPGAGTMLAETEITTEIHQYGDHAEFSDLIDLTHLDVTLARKVELFGNAGARAIDAIVRDELATCPNVIYAGGKSSRTALTAGEHADRGRNPQGCAHAQKESCPDVWRLLYRHCRPGYRLRPPGR